MTFVICKRENVCERPKMLACVGGNGYVRSPEYIMGSYICGKFCEKLSKLESNLIEGIF